jgi:RNA polymerase sigma-70 factor (ECF subfamily)
MAAADSLSTSPTLLRDLCDPRRSVKGWEQFLRRYQPLIHAWCLRQGLHPADADDVTGMVLARLVKAMKTFRYDPRRRFRAWLKRVVENVICDLREESRRQPGTRGSGDSAARQALEQYADPDAFDHERRDGCLCPG